MTDTKKPSTNDTPMIDPDKLLQLRLLHGYTRPDVSNHTDISVPSLHRLEKKGGGLRMSTARRLANFYRCTPMQLFDPLITAEEIFNGEAPESRSMATDYQKAENMKQEFLAQQLSDRAKRLFSLRDFGHDQYMALLDAIKIICAEVKQ